MTDVKRLLQSFGQHVQLSKREKILLVVLAVCLLSYGYYHWVLIKQLDRLTALEGDIAKKQAQLQEIKAKKIGDLATMRAQVAELEALIAKIYELVPNIKNTPGLVVDIYELLRRNNLTADNVTFGPLKAQQNYSTFTLSITVSGNALDVYNFLQSVEKYKRAVTIGKVVLTPNAGGMLTAGIELNVYVLHDVSPDPLDYPFMNIKTGYPYPLSMFKYPEPPPAEIGGEGEGESRGEEEAVRSGGH